MVPFRSNKRECVSAKVMILCNNAMPNNSNIVQDGAKVSMAVGVQ